MWHLLCKKHFGWRCWRAIFLKRKILCWCGVILVRKSCPMVALFARSIFMLMWHHSREAFGRSCTDVAHARGSPFSRVGHILTPFSRLFLECIISRYVKFSQDFSFFGFLFNLASLCWPSELMLSIYLLFFETSFLTQIEMRFLPASPMKLSRVSDFEHLSFPFAVMQM